MTPGLRQQASSPHDLTLVIGDLSSGGAQRVLTTLVNAWAERGLRLCVVTLAGRESDFFSLDSRVTRLALDRVADSRSLAAGIVANLGRVVSLHRALRRAGAPTVVAFIGVTNILTVLAATGLRLRVVICERNDPARQSLGRLWDTLRRLLYPRADLVTANSQGALDTLCAFVPERKLAFVPNPLVRPAAPAKAEPGPPTVLTVGRLTHQKAHDVLLRAFASIAAEAPDWRLMIIGSGELENALKGQAQTLGIADRVEWIGRTEDPFRYYGSAQIFALPSRYEGTPNALLEAMSAGLPAVVSDSSTGSLDYVEDGVSGLVVPVEDVDGLAAALARLVADGALRRRLGEAARVRVRSNELSNALAAWDQLLGFAA